MFFKIAVNWKPQSTPELMNKLYDCVDIQFHQTSEEKNDIFNSFLHDKKWKRTHAAMITSTDGTYAVLNKAKMIAKKPGQRKRPRTEKTQNVNKYWYLCVTNAVYGIFVDKCY
jgi:hypothetical protein